MYDLQELYQEYVLDHSRRPRNFRKLEDADWTGEGFNPLCGDQITLYLKIDDDMIAGVGCEVRGIDRACGDAGQDRNGQLGQVLRDCGEHPNLIRGPRPTTGEDEREVIIDARRIGDVRGVWRWTPHGSRISFLHPRHRPTLDKEFPEGIAAPEARAKRVIGGVTRPHSQLLFLSAVLDCSVTRT